MLLLIAAPVHGEQQVTLKGGTTLVGDVAFDGDALVVTIEGAPQRLTLAEVASVTPANFGPARQAQRMLITALEARLLGGAPREAVSLLAEASRLAPEDPQIAYWYASSLVDAGSGKAAERVLDAHRDAIDEAYPDRVARLAQRIKVRLLVELLPAPLVERIDALNAAAAVHPAEAHQRPAFAAFRVLDQFNDPVDQSAFSVQCNGQDERIEAFADGYFLVTYLRHRNSGDETCRLRFDKYGLKSEEVEFRAESDRVALAGQFVVHRYTDGDRRPVKIQVVDRDGRPVPSARVELASYNHGGGGKTPSLTSVADQDGRAELAAYPGGYSLSASADEFSAAREQVQLDEDAPQGVERRLTMHRRIPALVRIKWISAALHPGATEVTSDEGVLEFNGKGGRAHVPALMFLQPMQVQDRLQLTVNPMIFGRGFPLPGGAPWLKVRTIDDPSDPADRSRAGQAAFDAVDLTRADQLPDDFRSVSLEGDGRAGPPGVVQAAANFGDVFVGRFTSRDPHTGQPVALTFKALIERPAGTAPGPAAPARQPAEAP